MSVLNRIRVKLLGRVPQRLWLRQFPGQRPTWDRCDFVFDPAAREYDWLVVYDDLPPITGERFSLRQEALACPREHTLLITTEPPSIKAYGKAFVAQFGRVLTSQPDWALPHPGRIFSQPALRWFYGVGRNRLCTVDQMSERPPLEKTKILSTVCSSKQQRHTRHNRRYRFTQALKEHLPELDIYGRGVRDIDDKAETLDEYRYHLAIENYLGRHHWTEKLADAFLGVTLPFYCGCPNAAEYFPPDSFIPIDINDVKGAATIIRRAIEDNEFEKRLPVILEARRRSSRNTTCSLSWRGKLSSSRSALPLEANGAKCFYRGTCCGKNIRGWPCNRCSKKAACGFWNS